MSNEGMIIVTDVKIRRAREAGTLRVERATDRFGDYYWAISDDHGLIEVANTEAEAWLALWNTHHAK